MGEEEGNLFLWWNKNCFSMPSQVLEANAYQQNAVAVKGF